MNSFLLSSLAGTQRQSSSGDLPSSTSPLFATETADGQPQVRHGHAEEEEVDFLPATDSKDIELSDRQDTNHRTYEETDDERQPSNGDNLSSSSPFFLKKTRSGGQPQVRHGLAEEEVNTESAPILPPAGSKDGILSEQANYQRYEDSNEDASLSANRKSTNTIRGYICCGIIVAILIYGLGVLTGYMLEFDNDSSLLGGGTSLRARKILPKVTLGVYYYPWHSTDFHGRRYLREYVNQQPLLGEYNDRDPEVIAQHLEWSQRANIQLWVTSWWGPNSREDYTTREVILRHPDLLDSDHKISLFYETTGRIREEDNYSLHRVKPDMEYICSNYFSHPNYFRINGKPVVYVYLTRLLEDWGNLPQVIQIMRNAAQDTCNEEIYIIGDHIFGPPLPGVIEDAQEAAFKMLDGVTNYDVYGSIGKSVGSKGGYLEEEDVRRYYGVEQSLWKPIVNAFDCAYIPSVSPGYNDLGVRPEAKHPPLSRSLVGGAPGSLFQTAVESARPLVDPTASNVLMVNSFNEWHEDSQIEPVAGEPSSSPFNLTQGLSYEGYGTLYLDILRSTTHN